MNKVLTHEKGFTLLYEGVLGCVALYLLAGGKGA